MICQSILYTHDLYFPVLMDAPHLLNCPFVLFPVILGFWISTIKETTCLSMSPKRFVGVSNFQASNDFVNHPFGHHITNNINIGFRQKKLATAISIVTMSSINMFSIDNISLIFMPMTPSIFHKTTG